MNSVELALERDRLEAEIAEKRVSPEQRLTQVETELERRSAESAGQRAENRATYEKALDEYLAARDGAWAATREFVAAVERAALARRAIERVAYRNGARATGETLPDPVYVSTERDPKLRALRADARDAAGLARW
jgi:hypothetical protein